MGKERLAPHKAASRMLAKIAYKPTMANTCAVRCTPSGKARYCHINPSAHSAVPLCNPATCTDTPMRGLGNAGMAKATRRLSKNSTVPEINNCCGIGFIGSLHRYLDNDRIES